MTLRDDIATVLRTVVSVTTGIGETWQYRQMTSAYDVEPRTYGTAANIVGHQANRTHSEPFRTEAGLWLRSERCSFRAADNTTELKQGDQLSDPNSVYWSVVGIASTGVGTFRYDLSREVPLMADAGHNGGV